jgi:sugar lactone lactonase YvrE
MSQPEITEITTGLEFPEGPVAMPDGSVIVVELKGGRVTRVQPDGTKSQVAAPGARTVPRSGRTARSTSATAAAGRSAR